MSRKLALVIGNTTYTDARFATLATPGADVKRFADLLRNPDIGGFDEVEPLLDRDQSLVSRTVEKFFAGKMRDDLLLLYFSGHGMLDEEGKLYLAVHDTEWETPRASALSAEFVSEAMDRSRSQRIVLILDCCHSGAFAGAKGAVGGCAGTKQAFEGTGYGRWVLTATDATQFAWEGENRTGAGGTSVFTSCLVSGLQTGDADLDHDGFISVRDLSDYAYEQVVRLKAKQTPCLWAYKEQGNLIVASNPAKAVLPQELKDAVRSSFSHVRRGAVDELARMAEDHNQALALLARDTLRTLVDDDSRQVAHAARECLRALEAGDKPELLSLGDSTQWKIDVKRRIDALEGRAAQGTDRRQASTLPELKTWTQDLLRRAGVGLTVVTHKAANSLRPAASRLRYQLARPIFLKTVGTSVTALALLVSVAHYWPSHVTDSASLPPAPAVTNHEEAGSAAPPPASTLDTADAASSSSGTVEPPPSKLPEEVSPPKPKPQAATPTVYLPQSIMDTYLVNKPLPEYPAAARAAKIEGMVVLAALVDKTGRVSKLSVTTGHPLLAASAERAVRQWRYKPYLLKGRPAQVKTDVSVNFQIVHPAQQANAAEPPPLQASIVPSLHPEDPAARNPDPDVHSIGGNVSPPQRIYAPEPDYTDEARRAHRQGTVTVRVVVQKDGTVARDVEVLKKLGMGLDEQAVAAVRNWRFKPATKAGQPVAARLKIDLVFSAY